jgi:glycosyltransferase involved in cell wall biosynthesis
MEALFVILVVWFSFVLVFVLFLMFGTFRSRLPEDCASKNSVGGLSVIVPFKDESLRIAPLLASINQSHLPEKVEFIFVDDHSTDKTYSVISSTLATPFVLLKNSGNGKKAAIQTGVRAATYEHILTLDADVQFSADYFIELLQILGPDMLILPVVMGGGKGLGKFGSFEFSFLQLAGLGLGAWKKPVLCNGANLVFSRSKFLQVDAERTDYDTPSGDDVFLLSKFRERGFCIRVATAKKFSAVTTAPEGIRELLSQRRRWIGKARKMSLPPLLIGAFVIFASQAAMITSILLAFVSPLFIIPIATKFLIEFLIDAVIVKKLSPARILLLVLHQAWYPVYMLLLFLPLQSGRWNISNIEGKSVEDN